MNFPSWPHQAKSNDSILILGGDNTFGLAAIQLARACGYLVIAVADIDHRNTVEKYGAGMVLDVSEHILTILCHL